MHLLVYTTKSVTSRSLNDLEFRKSDTPNFTVDLTRYSSTLSQIIKSIVNLQLKFQITKKMLAMLL